MASEMNRYDILKQIAFSRKSTRMYSDRAVLDESIKKILDIAYTSPFASGRKRWDILVVDDKETIKNIAEATRTWIKEQAEQVREDFRDDFLQYAQNFTFFEQAPVLFIPIFRPARAIACMFDDKDGKIAEWERDSYTKSISAVATLILLAAESLDIKTCYMTGPLIAEERIMPLLNMKPGMSIGAIIPAGYEK
jgi:nitroreductase